MSDALAYESDPGQPPRMAKLTIFLIVLLDLLGFGIIIPLLPRYVPEYHSNPLKVTLLFSVYSICQFIGAPILGAISDRVGRRPVLALSQLGSAAGYVLLGVALKFPEHTLLFVYLSRILDGFTGGNISTAQAYMSDITTPQQRAGAMALLGVAFGVGFSIGPAVGGILGHSNPAIPAYFAAALAAGAGVLSWTLLREARKTTPAEAEVWLHPRQFRPVLRKPVIVQLLAISFFIMAAFVMMESTLVLFIDKHFHFKEWGTGWFFAFLGFCIIVVQGGLVRPLTKRLGEWRLSAFGPVLVAVGMLLFTASAFRPTLLLLLLAGAVNAAGRSLQQPTMSSLLSKFSDRGEQGVVFGLYHGLSSLARVAGPLAAGFAYPYVNNTGQFLLAAVVALAMAGWTFALWKRAGDPAPADLGVPPTAGEPHAATTEPA